MEEDMQVQMTMIRILYLVIFHLGVLLLIVVMIQTHNVCITHLILKLNIRTFNMDNIDIHFEMNILNIIKI